MRFIRLLIVLASLGAAGPALAVELVVNGSFESGTAPWTEISSQGFEIVTDDPLTARTGNRYAWLGGYESGTDVLHQTVTIPADAGQVSLSFWRLVNIDTHSPQVHDSFVVSVNDPSTGALLATIATFTNLDATGDWVQTPQYDLSAFRGRSVRLQFTATNDAANVTSFRIDDVTLATATAPPRLANLSTRMQVLTGSEVMIAGFIISGSGPKTVVINVAGPSLVNFGVTSALANPMLTLVRSSDQAIIGSNDDWQAASNAAQIQASGFAPNHSLEPAILATLSPGAYTAIVSGAGGSTGVGLVGVFEVDRPDVPLINISTRGRVLTGNDVMIAGFVIQGSSSQTVVINVAGPSLANHGIASPLLNPTLTLVRSSDQTVLAANDDWTDAPNAVEIQASGFAPNHAREPAILMTLPPGAYTAIVQGVSGTTGVALVGVFTSQ